MHEVPAHGIEARRWTVVFHRKAENRFFDLIAMGHFKHVSALAWIPELGQWWFYDVGFRRTRLSVMVDGVAAQATVAAIVTGNCVVTVETRHDGLPLMRLGMFCTTAVAHLIGVRSGALRPDALFRHLSSPKVGGIVSDDGPAGKARTSDRPEPDGRTGAGAEVADRKSAIPGAA
jgi:hypothetical protein